MKAKDYRAKARRALKGKWIRTALHILLAQAVLSAAGLIVSFVAMGPLMVSVFRGLDRAVYGAEVTTNQLVQIPTSFFIIVTLGVLIAGVVQSLLAVGMSNVGRAVLDGQQPGPKLLFPFGLLGKVIAMNLVRAVLVAVQLMLLIAPGVIAMYRYAMADYLLAAHPNLGSIEALRRSARRMKGRKAKLFYLQLSFVGWAALCALPAVAMNLWTNFRLFGAAQGYGHEVLVHTMLAFYGLSAVVILLGGIAELFVAAYQLVAVTAFFKRADKSGKKRKKALPKPQ